MRDEDADGLMRLGAERALKQLAADLAVSAEHCLPLVSTLNDEALIAAFKAVDDKEEEQLAQHYADEIERRGIVLRSCAC